MISKQLLIFDFDGTIVTEDSVSKVFEVLPKEIQREGFSHYVQLFQNASKQVENWKYLLNYNFNLTSENV
jgi:hypothetical protein